MAWMGRCNNKGGTMTDYDDTLTDSADRECCEPHGCPVPCRECKKVTQDDQADWKEGDR